MQLTHEDQFLLENIENNIIKLQQQPEARYFLTPFCTAHIWELISILVDKNIFYIHWWGGYEKAIRKIGLITKSNEKKYDNEYFRIQCYQLNWLNLIEKPKLRDIKRVLTEHCLLSEIGDILIENNKLEILVTQNASETIEKNKHELSQILKCSIMVINQPTIRTFYSFNEQEAFVASNRLDCIVSKIFRLPRSESQEAITMGFITVNAKREINPSRKILNDSEIFFKTKGIIRISTQTATKKGKLCIKYTELQNIYF